MVRVAGDEHEPIHVLISRADEAREKIANALVSYARQIEAVAVDEDMDGAT